MGRVDRQLVHERVLAVLRSRPCLAIQAGGVVALSFLIILVLACIVAIPVAYIAAGLWVQRYIKRTR